MSLRPFVLAFFLLLSMATVRGADAPLGGFVPFVGIGMTNEFQTLDSLDLGQIPFIAEVEETLTAPLLGANSTPYFDLALLDSGAAVHILTQEAFAGFDIVGSMMSGENQQPVGGATGILLMDINDAGGIYAAGLGDGSSDGTVLDMNTAVLRGQSSTATLTAPNEWALPNILGLPMVAQHAIAIRNSEPQVFSHQGRTVRTPQVELRDLGSGGDGIVRRAPLKLHPGISFVQGPQYVFNLNVDDILDIGGGGGIAVHDNPVSPTVVIDTNGNGAGLFLDVDLFNGPDSLQDKELLLDTGADLTVFSQLTAARLGFDAILDTPDFVLEVEGSGGVLGGVPGFYLDELNIDTIGGSFTMQNVPVAVFDVTNPNDPGNIIDGILGMHLFNGRDLVIDANASTGQGGAGPSLYISDPVTDTHAWASSAASATWSTTSSWSASEIPNTMWVADVFNVFGNNQTANVTSDSTVFQLTVAGESTGSMTVAIQPSTTLTTFGETRIGQGGIIQLSGGDSKLDAQFINIEGGVLTGNGSIFVGTGPLNGTVRNLSGRIEPGDDIGKLSIEGDLSNLTAGTLAFDLSGDTPNLYDQIAVDRNIFLSGILEVSLFGGFTPNLNDTFALMTAVELFGDFDVLFLPAGYFWSVKSLTNSVMLSVTGFGDIEGDFNRNGLVGDDDQIMWQEVYGTDEYDGTSFLNWQRNFDGSTGATASNAVPEPGTIELALLGIVGGTRQRRRRPDDLVFAHILAGKSRTSGGPT